MKIIHRVLATGHFIEAEGVEFRTENGTPAELLDMAADERQRAARHLKLAEILVRTARRM